MLKHRLFITVAFYFINVLIAQSFGQNKVQYQDFKWEYIQTPHFDIYYYEGEKSLAEFAADVAEESYEQISIHLRWNLKKRVSIMVIIHTMNSNKLMLLIHIWRRCWRCNRAFKIVLSFHLKAIIHNLGM